MLFIKAILQTVISALFVLLSFQIMAGVTEPFDTVEFAMPVNDKSTLLYAPESLSDDFKAYFNFISFKQTPVEKHQIYIDTPDRRLKKHGFILRVRHNLTSPSKSKVTIKLRDELSDFQDGKSKLAGFDEASMEFALNRKSVSFSYDLNYRPNEFSLTEFNVNELMGLLRSDQIIWQKFGSILSEIQDELIPTQVMRSIQWRGKLSKQFESNPSIKLEVWSPLYRSPRSYLVELSFKGSPSEFNELQSTYQAILNIVNERGLQASEFTRSKTEASFSMSKSHQVH